MYLSAQQIERSIEELSPINPFFGISFLAFKKIGLPVGHATELVFSRVVEDVLRAYYKPSASYPGFFHPFHTSDKSHRWVSERYGSTSLQRITADTFGDCLIHRKKTTSWGWKPNYLKQLRRHLGNRRIPAFHLAVWLFRNEDWPASVSPTLIRDRLFTEFFVNRKEKRALFDPAVERISRADWLQPEPLSETELLEIIGVPSGAAPEEGAALKLFAMHNVGPTRKLCYQPAERLNIVTGDNSLGKTFLLECVWWGLTGRWISVPAMPRRDSKGEPTLSFALTTKRKAKSTTVRYNWTRQAWEEPRSREALAGLVIYARYDGSFALWDPARTSQSNELFPTPGQLFFTRDQVWDGLAGTRSDRANWICNGMLRDWATWQTGGKRYFSHYQAFLASLNGLSPSGVEHLEPGEPTRIPNDAREVPTLRMPYGDVAVTQASAGVQRILALAYLLVWSWFEHLSLSSLIRRSPQRRIVLIIDEVEAHLHPRWQRLIVPAVMRVVAELAAGASLQIHLATHSPMILASSEPVFDSATDNLHHLRLKKDDVILEELPFTKRGRTDLWLISDSFGLGQPRSAPAETALEHAKRLQSEKRPNVDEVKETHSNLVKLLAPDDEFWPRWTYFAKNHGVKL